jgi:hypothetical protein
MARLTEHGRLVQPEEVTTLTLETMRQDDDETFPSGAPPGLPGLSRSRDMALESTITLVKVFSATKARDREQLGERMGAWLAANPALEVVRTSVTQTSDASFHCLSFVLFCAPGASA